VAAFKPEVPIYKLVDKIETKVQRLHIYKYMFTRSSCPMGLNGVYCDLLTRMCNSKMASLKPEILISKIEDKVGT